MAHTEEDVILPPPSDDEEELLPPPAEDEEEEIPLPPPEDSRHKPNATFLNKAAQQGKDKTHVAEIPLPPPPEDQKEKPRAVPKDFPVKQGKDQLASTMPISLVNMIPLRNNQDRLRYLKKKLSNSSDTANSSSLNPKMESRGASNSEHGPPLSSRPPREMKDFANSDMHQPATRASVKSFSHPQDYPQQGHSELIIQKHSQSSAQEASIQNSENSSLIEDPQHSLEEPGRSAASKNQESFRSFNHKTNSTDLASLLKRPSSYSFRKENPNLNPESFSDAKNVLANPGSNSIKENQETGSVASLADLLLPPEEKNNSLFDAEKEPGLIKVAAQVVIVETKDAPASEANVKIDGQTTANSAVKSLSDVLVSLPLQKNVDDGKIPESSSAESPVVPSAAPPPPPAPPIVSPSSSSGANSTSTNRILGKSTSADFSSNLNSSLAKELGTIKLKRISADREPIKSPRGDSNVDLESMLKQSLMKQRAFMKDDEVEHNETEEWE